MTGHDKRPSECDCQRAKRLEREAAEQRRKHLQTVDELKQKGFTDPKIRNKTRKQDCYICGNYKKRTHDCTAHFIRTDLLTAGVTANLKKITAYAAKHEKQFMKLLVQQNEDGGKRRNAAKKRELEAAEKRIGELSAIFKRLYEDSEIGRAHV